MKLKHKNNNKSNGDPLRLVWKTYCLRVTREGLLLVAGLGMLIFVIDQSMKITTGKGLGTLIFFLAAGLAWLFYIGVAKPFSLYRISHRLPLTKDLPETLKIIVPALRSKSMDATEMRALLGSRTAHSWFNSTRLIRNLVVFSMGLMGLIWLFISAP